MTSFEHDGAGDLVKIIDPDLSEREFAYDVRHRLTRQTSKRDFATTYDYGFHGRALQANRPDGSTNEYTPAEVVGLIDTSSGLGTSGNPAPFVRPDAVEASFTDGNDNTTTLLVSRLGGANQVIDAQGRSTITERDENNNITRIVQRDGRIDDFTFDDRGNLLIRTEAVGDPLERSWTIVYEPNFNQITQVIDPEQNVTTAEYDLNGNLVEFTDGSGTITTMTYADPNCSGQVTSITQAPGLAEEGTTNFVYGPNTCNMTKVIDPLSHSTAFFYDTVGNTVRILDADLRELRFEFNTRSARL